MMAQADNRARLIDGGNRSNWLGAAGRAEDEKTDAYGRLGLDDPALIELTDGLLDEVRSVLDFLASSLRQYEEPSRIKRFLHSLGPPQRLDRVRFDIVDLSGFHAEARKGSPYRIDISIGAILRTASLCHELAAIKLEQAARPPTSSIHSSMMGGALFRLLPGTDAAKAYARRLLLMGMLFLFGHELSHITYGHCDYVVKNRQVSDEERCALEVDADLGAGSMAAASMIQNARTLEILGYSIEEFTADSENHFQRDMIMAAVIQFVLLEEFADKETPRYLVPQLRLFDFIRGFIGYIRWSPDAPIGPVVKLNPNHLSEDYVNIFYFQSVGELMQTSVAPILENVSIDAAHLARAGQIARVRMHLKKTLVPLQPFNTPAYLETIRATRKAGKAP